MYSYLNSKISECKKFETNCVKWKKELQLQIQHIENIQEQNKNMMDSCVRMVGTNVCRKLDFSQSSLISEPETIAPISPKLLHMSPSLHVNNESTYITPQKTTTQDNKNVIKHIQSDSDSDDCDHLLRQMLDSDEDIETNTNKIKRCKQTENSENNNTNIRRKRNRTKKQYV